MVYLPAALKCVHSAYAICHQRRLRQFGLIKLINFMAHYAGLASVHFSFRCCCISSNIYRRRRRASLKNCVFLSDTLILKSVFSSARFYCICTLDPFCNYTYYYFFNCFCKNMFNRVIAFLITGKKLSSATLFFLVFNDEALNQRRII